MTYLITGLDKSSIQNYSTLGVTIQVKTSVVSSSIFKYYLVDNAKLFKEDLLKRNGNLNESNALNLNSLRLGVNCVISLSHTIARYGIEKLNLADNQVTDYGMMHVKNILGNNTVV